MVLSTVPGPYYIKRTQIFVNSNNRNPLKSKSGYEFVFDLPEELQNVVGIELLQYNVSHYASGTFVGRLNYGAASSGNFDKLANDTNNTTTTLHFESVNPGDFDFNALMYFDPAYAISILGLVTFPCAGLYGFVYLNEFLTQATWTGIAFTTNGSNIDGNFNPSILNDYSFNSPIATSSDNREYMHFFIQETSSQKYGTTQLLYKSRFTESSSAFIFGFHPYEDTVPDPEKNGALAPYMVTYRPYPYLDIFIQEVSELVPVARIPIVNDDDCFVATEDPPNKMRILLTPVPSLKQLTIRCVLRNNTKPSALADTGLDLVFEVFSLAQYEPIPTWIDQRIAL